MSCYSRSTATAVLLSLAFFSSADCIGRTSGWRCAGGGCLLLAGCGCLQAVCVATVALQNRLGSLVRAFVLAIAGIRAMILEVVAGRGSWIVLVRVGKLQCGGSISRRLPVVLGIACLWEFCLLRLSAAAVAVLYASDPCSREQGKRSWYSCGD